MSAPVASEARSPPTTDQQWAGETGAFGPARHDRRASGQYGPQAQPGRGVIVRAGYRRGVHCGTRQGGWPHMGD